MNNLFVLLIFISLYSCKAQDKKKSSPPAYNVHPEIEPYVKTFRAKMTLAGVNKSVGNLQASFADDLQVGEAGRCTIRTTSSETISYSTPILKLSASLWDLMSYAEREKLIYHELGHCILSKLHLTTLNNQIPISVMYPYLSSISEEIYTDNYGQYMAELFSYNSQEMLDLEFDDSTYY